MYKAAEYNESLAIQYADCLISINQRDAKETRDKYGRMPDGVINVTFKDQLKGNLRFDEEENKEIADLLFIGSNFLPNAQGVRWFVENVMPNVPAKLTVVGKGMESLASELKRDNVNVIGSVDDLTEYYERSDALVLPIFSGSGMKVKTAEAMMYGKIIFATDEALEGYHTIDRKIMRCNNKDDFVTQICQYVEKGVMKHSSEVRREYIANFSNEKAEKLFQNMVLSCLKK